MQQNTHLNYKIANMKHDDLLTSLSYFILYVKFHRLTYAYFIEKQPDKRDDLFDGKFVQVSKHNCQYQILWKAIKTYALQETVLLHLLFSINFLFWFF